MDLEQLLAEVISIATEAGQYLSKQRKTFRTDEVIKKGEHDFVSYVDKETEKIIINRLSLLLPQSGFITEEGEGKYTGEEYCWIVDPLDGTTNFIHNYAPYAVSIALREKNKIILGVVYEVCLSECFYALKGKGAFLNGEQIFVSQIRNFTDAFIGLGLPYNHQKFRPVMDHVITGLYGSVSGIRISGSAATNLCYVATGRYDIWFEAHIKLWDFAAGALIVQEAGGVITNFYGDTTFETGHHLVVSANMNLHDDMLQLLQPYNDEVL